MKSSSFQVEICSAVYNRQLLFFLRGGGRFQTTPVQISSAISFLGYAQGAVDDPTGTTPACQPLNPNAQVFTTGISAQRVV